MEIHLERFGSRIWMACRWRGDIPDRAKTIPGNGFVTSNKPKEWARSVNAGQFAPKGVWSFPLNWRTCRDLRAEFDPDCKIVIHKDLWAWAAAERQKRDALRALLRQERVPTPNLARVYPDLAEAVQARPFQSIGIEFAKIARRSINGDHPGLGKTLQSAATVVELDLRGPILVAAPSVASAVTWPDEFDAWLPKEPYIVIDGSKEQRTGFLEEFDALSKRHPRAWCFINLEMFQRDGHGVSWSPLVWNEDGTPAPMRDRNNKIRVARTIERSDEYRFPYLHNTVWSAAIVDEAHKILPTKASQAIKQSMMRAGIGRVPVRPDGLKMALSGTPMKGNPLNLWGILNWLYPEQYTGYWAFVERWFDVVEEEIGGGDTAKEIYGVRSAVAKDFGEEIDAVMIRRTKAEVAPWLPAKVYAGTRLDPKDRTTPAGIWLDMLPRQAKAYEQMVSDAIAHLENGSLQAIGTLAEMTRCKQMASAFGKVESVERRVKGMSVWEWVDTFEPQFPSNKWEWIEEFLEERGVWRPKLAWGEQKIVVSSWQTSLLKLFRSQTEKYNIPSLIITGETSNADRGAAKATFQAPGGPRLMFLNTLAGGVSLTLDAADDMVICDETWDPSDSEQVEDRIHRMSRKADRPPATYWYLRSRGTIEEHIAQVVADKDDLQKKIMDGRRGVSFAKRLLIGG